MEYTTQAALERRHQEDLQRLRGLRLLDDDFMTKVFEDKACAEFLLQIILQRSDLSVQEVHSQHEIKNLQGRSVRLDIAAIGPDGKAYDIEVQRDDRGAGVKRARYNSSLIDANITEPGDDYQKLAETYVIFITERDVLKGGLPIYHVDRRIEELGFAPFGDGAHILYVNAQIRDETALGRLMHDFSCTDAADMHYRILADRVRYFKDDVKGVATMCKAMEEMRREAAEEAARVAVEETKKEMLSYFTRNMLAGGKLSHEEIAEYSGLTVAEVKALAETQPA